MEREEEKLKVEKSLKGAFLTYFARLETRDFSLSHETAFSAQENKDISVSCS